VSRCLDTAHREVSSPLLWCLVVDKFIARLNRGGVYTQGYADDICLLVAGKFPNTVSGYLGSLESDDINSINLGATCNFNKVTGLP